MKLHHKVKGCVQTSYWGRTSVAVDYLEVRIILTPQLTLMTSSEFREHAHQIVDWIADYLESNEKYPVKSQVRPGEIYYQLPAHAPNASEQMASILKDFEDIIMPGVTHWQSPNFYAYFQANSSAPSVLGEMLTAALGVQAMKWETSPSAAELEEMMMRWLMQEMSIPDGWSGVIQDTASTATLAAMVTAREKLSGFAVNKRGYDGYTNLRVYCSTETHSSIEKGARIMGIGSENVVKIPVDENLALRPDLLRQVIEDDVAAGYQPLCVVAAIGTTGSLAMDPLRQLGEICEEFGLWLHVDAAYAGTALVLPEYRHLIGGIELADSFVFNAHKWMFTNFDCSIYFVKDRDLLVNTFAILPEYLKTKADGHANNYCDWGIPLGRRFRALKLWFVIRSYGMDGIRNMLREHIRMAEWVEEQINARQDFELVVPRTLNLLCLRYCPNGYSDDELNALNRTLLDKINSSGKIYMTHTVINGKFVIRMSIGATRVTQQHVDEAWALISGTADDLV